MQKWSRDIRRSSAVAALMLLFACGGGRGGGETAADTRRADEAAPAATSAGGESAAAVSDACTFMDRDEMARRIGRELREGVPEDAPPGFYACDFSAPPQLYQTMTFPDPPLPESVSFSSVTIGTFPTTAQQFDEFRHTLGAAGEDVNGIGDRAYFYGPNMIYVRSGGRAFSLRMHASPQKAEEEARARAVMLSLAELGASRLK